MGCNSSKQVQIEASSGTERVVRGDLYVAWPSAPCRATLMTCAALGVKPNLKPLDLFKGETNSPEFKAINPSHTVPTYVDGDFILWESRAVNAYLVATFGGSDNPLYPKDTHKRAKVDSVLNADSGTFAKPVAAYMIPQLTNKTDGVDMEKNLEDVKTAFKVLNDHFLSKTSYVAGDQLTIAVLSNVTFTEIIDLDLSEYPNIEDWRRRMKKLPYFEKCNAGLYKLKETLQQRNSA